MNFSMIASSIFDTSLDFIMFTIIMVISSILMIFVGYRLLQILQLTGYKLKSFLKWFKETKFSYVSRLFMLSFLSFLAMVVTGVLLGDFFTGKTYIFSYIGITFYILFSCLFIVNLFNAKQKSPLKYTKRMTRLVVVYVAIVAFVTWLAEYIGFKYFDFVSYAFIAIVPIMLPLVVLLAYFITYPLEKIISNTYISKAKKKLKSLKNIKVIGITGSYGKTSVKNILSTILSEKFKICPTPASYNTPLGLAKTVLLNLEEKDEIFIAEMGARQQNDIMELCNMVRPTVGLITGVGNQHLLTFGSVENIIKTKAELAEFIQNNDGEIYINTDGINAKKLAESYKSSKRVSLEGDGKVKISNIKTTKDGSTFEIEIDGKLQKCKTILLGEHNISNILLAANVACDLGLSLEEIAAGIEKLHTVPHRLEIIKSSAKYTIIDNSYNSSVQGSEASIKVLSTFSGKKFVITPGLVELGKQQFNCNFEFGRTMAPVCDYVIIDSLINFDAIKAGLIFAGFDEEHILQAGSLSQAVKVLNSLAEADDVVLFENDLPDNYF
ncbi:MAG: UDP-N-acetylmuramoyl-tripeptide--D-alanyl-D-alanine ligase [Clostridia bacterium]|nr:UDP-N-acetylmuramoyl-tripeptide--D-alanyl-D-alanine ligase [Clostridia bacterium]